MIWPFLVACLVGALCGVLESDGDGGISAALAVLAVPLLIWWMM